VSIVEDLSTLTSAQIEDIEKLTTRWLYHATFDFGMEAYEVFLKSPDEVKDIAEDITREVLDRLSGYNVQQRIFGTVDYKKARYIVLPERMVRQALFVDSKAEKDNRTATIQMSQTSLRVRQVRASRIIDEAGLLRPISIYNDKQYLTTTALLHFMYEDVKHEHHLREVTICCLPNGLLQDRYNPSERETIWLAGRDAPTRGEDFRVRLSFTMLQAKAAWRVQRIAYSEKKNICAGEWSE
jgi:hypothetical protein